MKILKKYLSFAFYLLATTISALATSDIARVYYPFWIEGEMILGAFVAPFIFIYVPISLVLWAAGHWLHNRRTWNRLNVLLTSIPVLMLATLRSQDWIK